MLYSRFFPQKRQCLCFLTICIFAFSSLAQAPFSSNLNGEWLAENVVAMHIKGDSIIFDNQPSIFCSRSSDTIFATQQQRYSIWSENLGIIEKDTILRFHFIFSEKDSNTLIVKSLDFAAMDFWKAAKVTEWTNQYTFYRKKSVENSWFDIKKGSFKKLAFTRSGNEEDFSNIKFEILPNRTIYFQVKIDTNAHPQHPYKGLYKGKLPPEVYNKIISLLAQSAFYRTSEDWTFITCGSLYLVSVLTPEGFRKCLGGIIPQHCQALITYLEQLFFEKTWQPCNEKYEFKFLNKKTKKEIEQEKMMKKFPE